MSPMIWRGTARRSCRHDRRCAEIGVEDLSRAPTSGAVAAVRPLEVLEAEPGLKVGIDVSRRRVEAVAEGRAVVQVEYAPLEALDEGVQVGRPRWELVPADAKPRPRARDFLGQLFLITAVGKMTAWRPRIGSAAGEADDGP